MGALRAKSERLTGYLESLILGIPTSRVQIITPTNREARGCQLSLQVPRDGQALFEALQSRGFVCDFRAPDVVRVAPAPLYNGFHEVWRFGVALGELLQAE